MYGSVVFRNLDGSFSWTVLCLVLLVAMAGRGMIAQTVPVFEAKYISADGKKIKGEDVEIVTTNNSFELKKKGAVEPLRSLAFSQIVSAEYEFADKPTIARGLVAAGLLGLSGFPLFFNSTKRNWLSINADDHSMILELRSKNYRMLLLNLSNSGVKIIDRGDRDKRAKEERQRLRQIEKRKREETLKNDAPTN